MVLVFVRCVVFVNVGHALQYVNNIKCMEATRLLLIIIGVAYNTVLSVRPYACMPVRGYTVGIGNVEAILSSCDYYKSVSFFQFLCSKPLVFDELPMN